jgi:hypothetical protein
VVAWIQKQVASELCTSTLTEAEIFYGIELLSKGKRREGLLEAAQAMFAEDFAGRVFGFESDAAQNFARIAAHRRLLAGLSVMPTPKSRPLSERGERSLPHAILTTWPIAALISSTLGDFDLVSNLGLSGRLSAMEHRRNEVGSEMSATEMKRILAQYQPKDARFAPKNCMRFRSSARLTFRNGEGA